MGIPILEDRLEESGRDQRTIKSGLGRITSEEVYKGPSGKILRSIKVIYALHPPLQLEEEIVHLIQISLFRNVTSE